MSRYQYSSLLPGPNSIRLLRLLPDEDENAPIQCQLIDISLQESGKRTPHYDALSYVWGDPNNVRSIYIDEHYLTVTENLYAALLQLRDLSFERIIWVDAVCINQKNVKEKEDQIQLMAKIYSQATRVLVWLGKARDNSDQALEEIRAAGRDARKSINHEIISLAVLDLLQRTWFRRIWILQEVAAARHILIMCGSTEIDGHAFCLGIDSLTEYFQAHTELQGLIRSVTYLIRGAIFRTGGLPQAIGPLGELIDLYHGHEAALLHDKVYALLGMNSEDLGDVNLRPDYKLSWEELFQRLTRFLLGNIASMEICTSAEIAIIKTKACILGKISSVEESISLDGRQGVEIILGGTSSQLGDEGDEGKQNTHWTLHPTAQPVLAGDFICLLQEASKPTVIRLRKDHFIIIMIAASPPEMEQTKSAIQGRELFHRDFLLVWDWKGAQTSQYIGEDGKALLRKNDWVLESSKAEAADDLNKAARIWNVVITLDDLEEQKEAEERLEAILGLETAFEKEYLCLPKFSRAPLLWAARSGYEAMVKLLLEKGAEVNIWDKYYPTPLLCAARNGHTAVIKLLLEKGAIVDLWDNNHQTPLAWAAKNGHKAVVKLLLKEGAKVDLEDRDQQTPLTWAAKNGHKAVVKLLLEKGAKVNSDFSDQQIPLLWAAKSGHKAVVKLLLEKGAKVDSEDRDQQTPLAWAAKNGHKAVVKLLLEKGAKVDLSDDHHRTPLSWAAANGHEAVIKLLQQWLIVR